MHKTLLILASCALVNAIFGQHPNIKIGADFNPNEPSICLNPQKPAQIVAGANLNNVYYSTDTGKTWTAQLLTSPYGVWGDPVIGIDKQGDFLFLHLSNPPAGNWIDRIVCQKSTDAGQTWSPGTFTGLNGTKAQDKHWIAIDPINNYYYVTWTEFDKYGSGNTTDSSRILFSRSTDAGGTWSPAMAISQVNGDCLDSDNTTEGAVPCIGPNGEIYVSWAGPAGLVFDKSTDGGMTWLATDIPVNPIPGGWDYDIPGLQRCNGLPVTTCDRSNGPNHGAIYINWTDQRNGPNDTDVWLVKSMDGGQTWSAPSRVNNDPPGRHQFLSWMTIDQSNGWLWFVFYDRRNHPDSNTDVYMAVSTDGGATFKNFKVSETPFVPFTGQFFGDYNNIAAHNGIVRPMWTRMDGVNTSVWTALVDVNAVVTTETEQPDTGGFIDLQPSYPNPAGDETWIPFKIRRKTALTLQIANQEGQVVKTVFENKLYDYGKYTERVPLREFNLSAGTYWILLVSEGKVLSQRMAVVKP